MKSRRIHSSRYDKYEIKLEDDSDISKDNQIEPSQIAKNNKQHQLKHTKQNNNENNSMMRSFCRRFTSF